MTSKADYQNFVSRATATICDWLSEETPVQDPPDSPELIIIHIGEREYEHYDISWGLLAEARDLCSKISVPGAGDRKTVAVWILCSVAIEATLNYAYRFAGLRLHYSEEQVSECLRRISNREKLKIVRAHFEDDKDYQHAFRYLYDQIGEGILGKPIGKNRNRLVHHQGEFVPMSINQARSAVAITEKILRKLSLRALASKG